MLLSDDEVAGVPKSMNQELLQYLFTLRGMTPHPVYLVGGAVRDLLLGLPDIKDIDLLIPSGSEAVARRFAERISGSFFVLDEERRISRVVKNDDDTFLQFDFADLIGPDLEADLGRRDFTINAMALELGRFLETRNTDGVIDLFGGREDIRDKQIRITRQGVLDEDPLRMLRAVRFSAALDFRIEDGTREQIRSLTALMTSPAPERIRDELFLILSQRGAGDALLLMDSLGLLQKLFPEVEALQGFAPGMYHAYDVKTHSLKAVAHVDSVLDDLPGLVPTQVDRVREHLEEELEHLVPRKAALRFACLLHDIAKPETFSQGADGRIHFYGHDSAGADKAGQICARFRLSRETTALVTSVIKHHMRLFNLATPGGPSRNSLYRYCRDLKTGVPESLLLSQADARATFDIMPKERFLDTQKPMAVVMDYYYEKFLKVEAKPLITGDDLIEKGLKPGPRFRELLDEVKERQAVGMLKDRRDALDFLATLDSEAKREKKA
jgi:poly(A) polymerase